MPPLGMAEYGERIVMWGESDGSPTDPTPHVLRISEKGKPESFNLTHGFLTVDPAYGSRITNCIERDGVLYVFKDIGIYAIRDNGGEPNTWDVEKISGDIGTSIFGLARSYYSAPAIVDGNILYLNENGLNVLGSNIPLTWNVDALFAETQVPITDVECYVDTSKRLIFLNGYTTSVNAVLTGDYSKGLSAEGMRWSVIVPAVGAIGANNIVVSAGVRLPTGGSSDVPIGGSLMLYKNGATKGYSLRLNPANIGIDVVDGVSTAIVWTVESNEIPFNDSLGRDQYVAVSILWNRNASPGTNATVSLVGTSAPSQTLVIPTHATDEQISQLTFNGVGSRAHVKIESAASVPGYPIYIKQIMVAGAYREATKPRS
jgi:hypothetical protein